jgi:hypothetical protein
MKDMRHDYITVTVLIVSLAKHRFAGSVRLSHRKASGRCSRENCNCQAGPCLRSWLQHNAFSCKIVKAAFSADSTAPAHDAAISCQAVQQQQQQQL